MRTISAANKAWLKSYCQDRAKAAAEFDSADLATVFEAFFYLGGVCRASGSASLPREMKRALQGGVADGALEPGSAP